MEGTADRAVAGSAAGSVGDELRRLREAAGLTIRELAQRTYYSVGHISNVEHGKKPVTADFARACDAALSSGGSLQELVADTGRRVDRPAGARPAQLPPAPRLVGRDVTLWTLDRLFSETRRARVTGVLAIDGQAGVGKTSIAVAWSHRVKDRFPDGVFFADLHGHAPEARPLDAGEVLEDFLRVLGIQPADMPSDVERRAARWRTALDGTRTLIVLDNAASERQVRPLIPAAEGCLVVVTSRRRLSGLAIRDGARRLAVEPFDLDDGLVLLRAVVGDDRVESELDAAEQVVQLCGGLPLAVRVAAEHIATHPHLTLGALAGELSLEDRRLDVLSSDDEDSVRAVFSWTYQALSDAEARLFRRLGLHPGPTLCPEAAAALLAAPVGEARRLLERLAAFHLADEVASGRFRQHDLLKAYAVERANTDESAEERGQATLRIVDWYLHTAYRAAQALFPYRFDLTPDPPTDGVPDQPASFTYDEALDWYEAELANLGAVVQRAADTGLYAHAWKLPVVMWNFFHLRKRWTSRIATHTAGLAAARAAGDRRGTAWLLNNLANAHRELRQFDLARDELRLALSLREETGDLWGQAWTLLATGLLDVELGDAEHAAEMFAVSVRLFRQASDEYGTASGLAVLGDAHRLRGDVDGALEHLGQALGLMRCGGDRYGEGYCLAKMGAVYQAMGRHTDALHHFDRALSARSRIGDRWGQAEVLVAAGHSHHAIGGTDAARTVWHQALAIFDELDDPRAATVRSHLELLAVPAPRQES